MSINKGSNMNTHIHTKKTHNTHTVSYVTNTPLFVSFTHTPLNKFKLTHTQNRRHTLIQKMNNNE